MTKKIRGGGRYLCSAVLLAFMLSAGFFLSACGGGGSTGAPTLNPGDGGGNPGGTNPGDGGGNPGGTNPGDGGGNPGGTNPGDGGGNPGGTNPGDGGQTPPPVQEPVCPERTFSVGILEFNVKNAYGSGNDIDPDGEGISILGNANANIIKGGSGPDCISGGAENDLLQGNEGDDYLNGGPGSDTVLYSITDTQDNSIVLEALDISLEDGEAFNDGHGDTDTLTDIENVQCRGSILQDNNQGFAKIVGNDRHNELEGCNNTKAEELLIGLGGDDLFTYSNGENYYDGGEGTDTLNLLYSSITEDATVNLSLIETGNNMDPEGTGGYGKIADNTQGPLSYVAYAKVETGSSTTAGEGRSTIENIIGTDFGSDTLTGDADDNIIDGRGGNDTLAGKGGNDTLIGGPGTDALAGNAGDDTYYADSSDTVTEAPDDGDDTVYYTDSTAIAHSLTYAEVTATDGTAAFAPPNVETVYGTSNADILRAAAGDVTVIGGNGEDTLIGGDGDNTLIGCGVNRSNNTFYSNVGDSSSGDAPYTLPNGLDCASGTHSCGSNTFVLVDTLFANDADVINSFGSTDKIILAGFSSSTALDDVTAAAAANSDLNTAGLTDLTTGDSAEWTDLEVNDITVAFIKGRAADFPEETDSSNNVTKTVSQVLASHLTTEANEAVEFDSSYITGCYEI